MSNWQEAAAARLDQEASWWYTQTLDDPGVQRAAEELWGLFWEGRTEQPEIESPEYKKAVFGAIDIITHGIDGLRFEVPITLGDAISGGTREVYYNGRGVSVRVMASEVCRRALDHKQFTETVVDVSAASPVSAGEMGKAA